MVSVLMCTYNRENYLRRAIDSVLGQSYQDLELVIIDDGSTDGSRELIEGYEDDRITYYKLDKNHYYCYAANYGLLHCSGDYIAFMNSDDEWLPDKLLRQVQFLKEHPECGACFSAVSLIDNEGHDISEKCIDMKRLFATHYDTREEWMNFFLFHGNCLCHPSAMVRAEVMKRVGGFNLMYCQLADYDLWIRIVTETAIHVIPEPLIRFRWDVEKKNQISSVTKGHTIRTFNEHIRIREQLVDRLTEEQLVEFYGKRFRNKDSRNSLELQFERAFLLMDCITEAPGLKVLGMERLEKVLRLPGAAEVLAEHFKLRLQDIYEWNQEHWYIDQVLKGELEEQKYRIEQQNRSIQEQEQELHRQSKELLELRELVHTYEHSTSWKCTRPLRMAGQGVKHIWSRKNTKKH